MTALLAADTYKSNAHLIEACAQLGYLRADWLTLDPTYGRGNWWTRWRPDELLFSDLLTGVDFRNLPLADDSVDAAAFDPPYVCKGGRETSGMKDFDAAYGIDVCPSTPALLQSMIVNGMRELDRVVRPRGVILQKTQSYISSGKLQPAVQCTWLAAQFLDWTLVDEIVHLARAPRPQPPGRRQVHFRRNYSTLLVWKTPRG